MAPKVRTNPLNLETPISKETGAPTPFFVRQWQSLLDLVASLITIQQEIIEINDATITAGTGLGGGGQISSGAITIDLENTAVAPGSYTAANITVDAQGRVTSAANGAAGIRVEDEGTSIVASAVALNFTGAGVTVTDAGSGEATVNIPGGGGGGGWTLISNITIAAPTVNFDFNVLGYKDVMVITRNITKTAAAAQILRCSVDGGATFFAGASDYARILDNGAESLRNDILLHDTSLSSARSGVGILYNIASTLADKMFLGQAAGAGVFVGSALDVDFIRITTTSGTTMLTGTIQIYGR